MSSDTRDISSKLQHAAAPTSGDAIVPKTGRRRPEDREQYFPIRKADLIRQLACNEGLSPEEREPFQSFAHLLEAILHYEYHQHLEQLKESYAPFDPDTDSCSEGIESPSTAERKQLADSLMEGFSALLTAANFRRLNRDQITDAVGQASPWGVNLTIDFDIFDQLEVYARGDTMGQRTLRRWQNMWREETYNLDVYQRLVVIFRLRDRIAGPHSIDADTVSIKLFKNIPKQDMEMLLPGAQVKMTLFDRGKILLPTLSGVGVSIFKIIKGAVMITVAGFWGILATLGFLAGTIGYGVKSFFSYLSTKDKYMLNLTRSLYYQNLDNNAGVLFRILDEAEEQEFREAVLAYFFLWRRAPQAGWNLDELDQQVEAYLRQWLKMDIDFEVDDAVGKLQRWGLVQEHEDSQRLTVVPIDTALIQLDQRWDQYFTFANVCPPNDHARG